MEEASPVTVSTADTSLRLHGDLFIVIGRHIVSCLGRVVILVHKPDVDASRTGQTVVTADTVTKSCRRGKLTDDGVIPLLYGGFAEAKEGVKSSIPRTPGTTASIPGPAVFPLAVIDRSKMELEKHLVPLSCSRSAKGAVDICLCRRLLILAYPSRRLRAYTAWSGSFRLRKRLSLR